MRRSRAWAPCRCRLTSPRGARRTSKDRVDYQTIFAREEGAVAAPTAGLHFTPRLIEALKARGVSVHFVTLHVGPGTFLPVRSADTGGHIMHEETGTMSSETAAALNAVQGAGREHRRRRHHVAPAAGKRGRRGRQACTLLRRHQSLHHARLPLSLRRSAGDEFPSAALDPVHAGRGLLRARPDEARLCPCRRRALPLLFLRRCLSIEPAMQRDVRRRASPSP